MPVRRRSRRRDRDTLPRRKARRPPAPTQNQGDGRHSFMNVDRGHPPNSRGGVTDWRKVVVLMNPQDRTDAKQEKTQARKPRRGNEGRQRHHAGGDKAGDRSKARSRRRRRAAASPVSQQRADHHAGTEHRKRHADACRR